MAQIALDKANFPWPARLRIQQPADREIRFSTESSPVGCGLRLEPRQIPHSETVREICGLGNLNIHCLSGPKLLAIGGGIKEMLHLFPCLNFQAKKPACAVGVPLHKLWM